MVNGQSVDPPVIFEPRHPRWASVLPAAIRFCAHSPDHALLRLHDNQRFHQAGFAAVGSNSSEAGYFELKTLQIMPVTNASQVVVFVITGFRDGSEIFPPTVQAYHSGPENKPVKVEFKDDFDNVQAVTISALFGQQDPSDTSTTYGFCVDDIEIKRAA